MGLAGCRKVTLVRPRLFFTPKVGRSRMARPYSDGGKGPRSDRPPSLFTLADKISE
jgi:hypothetical protein